MTEWTFSMIDLAGYTALTETHGDERAADLAVGFAAIATQALAEGDRLIKPIGDAVLLASTTPASGLALVGRILDATTRLQGYPLARAGLHHGPAVQRDGDVFGAAVNLAARVAGQAGGGQVLATREVADIARQSGIPTSSLGAVSLRNLQQPVDLFEVALEASDERADIDPVCRMRVARAAAAGRLQHEGKTYWFCSLECVAIFASDPSRILD